MKLSSKIAIMSILIFSVAFGISSYQISWNSYEETIEREVTNCLEQNKMINAMYQLKILQLISTENFFGEESLRGISIFDDSGTYLIKQALVEKDGGVIVGEIIEQEVIQRLIGECGTGSQVYQFCKRETKEKEEVHIISTSGLAIGTSNYYVLNEYKVTEVFESLKKQQDHLRLTLLITLISSCIGIYMFTILMTKPIHTLVASTTEIAKGNFKTRTNIRTRDEVGELSRSFDVMAQEIEFYVEKMQQESDKKEAFMANFTHELKTPLTTVIGYADLLRRPDIDKSIQIKGAEYIFTEGKRLQKMSMKLLNLFLIGKESLAMQAVYLPVLLEEAIDSVKGTYQEKGINIVSSMEEIYAMGDYELLKEAVINLMDNSRKASCEGQSVKVSVRRTDTGCAIQISDSGSGIGEQELGRITEAFYMVDKSRTRKEGGAGLGLSLVATIVKAMDATLEIKSSIGKGTCVNIYLKEKIHEGETI